MKLKLLSLAIPCCAVAFCCLQACKKSGPLEGSADTKPSGAKQAGATAPGEAVELKAKWPIGNNYTYRMDLTHSMTMKMPGMPQPMQQELTLAKTYSLAVLAERPNNGRELEFQIDAMEMDSAMGGMEMSFDSKADAEADKTNPFAGPFRKIVGSKLKLFVSGEGRLESVEKLEEWQEKVLADSSPPVQMFVRSIYSQDFLKQLVETSQSLPQRPVKVGETWPFRTDVPTGPMGKMAIEVKVKLKGFEQYENRHCAVLDSSGTLKGSGGEAGPMGKMSIEEGTLTGTSWFDPELGAMVGMDSDQKMQLKIEPPVAAPGGVKSISGDISQKVVLKLVDLKSGK